MLKQLSVSNYALIEQIEVSFDKGLTIITGETGAGKSILLGALGLILGDRADNSSLRDQERKCVIEGLFDIADYGLESFFIENELDHDKLTTLRREIVPGGKSRAFINDTPVTLTILKDLGEQLIDIHAQHQTRLLNSFSFQLNLLDAYAGTKDVLADYKNVFSRYSQLKNQRRQLEEEMNQAELNRSFIEFQFTELDQAKLENESELADLEQELTVLSNAGLIKQSLQHVKEILAESDSNAISALQNARNALQKAGHFHQPSNDLSTRIESVFIELKDIAAEAEAFEESLQLDEERLSFVSARIDLLNRMLTKHRLTDLADLITFRNDLQRQLSVITAGGEELESLSLAINLLEKELHSKAKELSALRAGIAPMVAQKVNDSLRFLGMPHAEMKIELSETNELKLFGINELSFLLRSNLGSGFQSIDKVASGGELSRIMLCLKAVNAEKVVMPTIIFDEIDTGVSGEIASKMGEMLKSLSRNIQVISISHLPQIAGKGNAHFKVSKQVKDDTTVSKITKLEREERIREIAGMISGAQITEAAMENARILLQE